MTALDKLCESFAAFDTKFGNGNIIWQSHYNSYNDSRAGQLTAFSVSESSSEESSDSEYEQDYSDICVSTTEESPSGTETEFEMLPEDDYDEGAADLHKALSGVTMCKLNSFF